MWYIQILGFPRGDETFENRKKSENERLTKFLRG